MSTAFIVDNKPCGSGFRPRRNVGSRPKAAPTVVLLALLLPVLAPAAEGRRNRDRDTEGSRAAATTPAAAPAATPAVSPANSFDAFRIITEKNIFNPNRVGLTRATPEARPARVDEIALVGTVEFGGQRVALFDSAEVAWRKSVREGESLGDFTVKRVGPEGVDLVRGEQTLSLRVAQQLRRPEGEEWAVVAAPDLPRADARGGDSPAAPAIPADASDVLKRLMRQREKQLK